MNHSRNSLKITFIGEPDGTKEQITGVKNYETDSHSK